jgi:SAM-dependent methyltransferase
MDSELIARRWDAEYRLGRYADAPPLRFVAEILDTLRRDPVVRDGIGLYVGCGNGRNYLPLVDSGLRLCGLDLSLESLHQLNQRRPGTSLPLICGEFGAFRSACPFNYLVALQVFQHGTEADIAGYFNHASALLRPGGLFFLRVNSISTQIYHAHTVIERNVLGGITVRYDEGPKTDLPVHFYSRAEMWELTRERFQSVTGPREDVIPRSAPKTGSWVQWEGVWRRQ